MFRKEQRYLILNKIFLVRGTFGEIDGKTRTVLAYVHLFFMVRHCE